MKDVIFLVHSGDKSSNIWDYWYYYWKKFWTCAEFIDTVFLCKNLTKDYKGVQFYHTGNVSWSDGLINFLEKMDSRYIIYQHEDYFLTEETWDGVVKKLLMLCREHDFKLLKCCGLWSGFTTDKTPLVETSIKVNDKEVIWLYNNESPYLVSHQTSIWEREFLLSTLRRGETPWQHELAGTARLRKRNVPIYSYRGKSPFDYAETMVHGNVRKGFEKFFEVDICKQQPV